MKRQLATALLAVALAATLAPAVTIAAPETRLTPETANGLLTFGPLTCGAVQTVTRELPVSAVNPDVVRPPVDQRLGSIAQAIAVDLIERPDGRTVLSITAQGAFDLCSSWSEFLDDDERVINAIVYEVTYERPMRPGEVSTCARRNWGKRKTTPYRNGWVRCPQVSALMRAWAQRARSTPRLDKARIRGFRCKHHPSEITCVKGRARATWNAQKPPKPKPKPRPIPGPLGWAEAKRTALDLAYEFPIVVSHRKVTWCNRWDAWEVHCGVEGWNTDYDSVLGEITLGDTCTGTAYVRKRPGKHARAFHDGNFSCIYD
jgi:hypothetical protein